MQLAETIIRVLLQGGVVLATAKLVPGIVVRSYGAAVGVAAVYGILSWLLKGLLIFLSFPFIIVTFGLFLLVLNAFLLWLTDKLLDSFEIKGFGPLAFGTVLITIGGMLVDWIVR
jgi:putative membrane protein